MKGPIRLLLALLSALVCTPAHGAPPDDPPESGADDQDPGARRALERALVRQGGLVLPRWTLEIEPSVAYAYSEGSELRHDTFTSRLGLRLGLPWEAQVQAQAPVVLFDAWEGRDAVSGLGDVELGATKLLVLERDSVPELLLSGRWRTTTGGDPPTGTGAQGFLAMLTAVKRDEPVVFIGSAYGSWNLPSGDVDLGDAVGASFGLLLAATPESSVQVGVDLASLTATRVGKDRIAATDRLIGLFGIGASTIVGKDFLLNLRADIGLTSAAPDLQLAISLPVQL